MFFVFACVYHRRACRTSSDVLLLLECHPLCPVGFFGRFPAKIWHSGSDVWYVSVCIIRSSFAMYLVKSISFVLMLSEVYTSRQFAKRRSTYSSSSAKKSFSTCRSEIQIPSSWSMTIPGNKSPHPTDPRKDIVRIREGGTKSGDKRNRGPGRDVKN